MSHSQIDSALAEACRAACTACEEKCLCCENAVRRSPWGAMASGVALGYVLQLLPVCRIVAGLGRILFSLIKPALLLYAGAKMVEHLRCSCAAKCAGGEPDGPGQTDPP